ncbi:hypothetical protein [Pseudoalteromonas galatheae]
MSLIQLEEPSPKAVCWYTPSTWPVLMLGFRALFLLARAYSLS